MQLGTRSLDNKNNYMYQRFEFSNTLLNLAKTHHNKLIAAIFLETKLIKYCINDRETYRYNRTETCIREHGNNFKDIYF